MRLARSVSCTTVHYKLLELYLFTLTDTYVQNLLRARRSKLFQLAPVSSLRIDQRGRGMLSTPLYSIQCKVYVRCAPRRTCCSERRSLSHPNPGDLNSSRQYFIVRTRARAG